MAPGGHLLNAEPADPVEREENELPPKSYAEAAIEEFQGQGEADPKPGSKKANGRTRSPRKSKGTGSEIVIERFTDRDGDHLVSFRPTHHPGGPSVPRPRRTNSELLSGRKAGARWAKSP